MKLFILPVVLLVASLPSCQTPVGQAVNTAIQSPQAQDAIHAAETVIGQDAAKLLVNAGTQEITGQKVDLAQAASAALFSAAGDVGLAVTGSLIRDATGNALPKTADAAARIASTPNPTNAPSQVQEAIASVISAIAGSPPANPVAVVAAPKQ